MGQILVLLLAASLVGPGQRDEPTRAVRLLHEWMTDVQAHRPGEVDQPLLEVADMAPGDLDTVRRTLDAAIKTLRSTERNDLLRRGALVHTDIALLLPERAAEYHQSPELKPFYLNPAGKPILVGREADRLFFTLDGEFVRTSVETAHWSMARQLLSAIEPRPDRDEFVPLWYRAVAAHFEQEGLFGNAKYQLDHGLDVLPRDPVLLFYAGAMDASETALLVGESQPGRALVIVFSDGVEVSSYLDADAVLDTAKRTDAVVYAVARRNLGPFLRDLTDATGGDLFEIASTQELDAAFVKVLEQFRHRYLLSYTPRGVATGGWHRLQVRVHQAGATVRARPGYLGG